MPRTLPPRGNGRSVWREMCGAQRVGGNVWGLGFHFPAMWCSQFFSGDQVHLNAIYERGTDCTRRAGTVAYCPGPRRLDRPVSVLTSARTFSGVTILGVTILGVTILGVTFSGVTFSGGEMWRTRCRPWGGRWWSWCQGVGRSAAPKPDCQVHRWVQLGHCRWSTLPLLERR
ncbi:hypothetical protein HEK616_41460 [Streptomyces nigrescens]|uniref:Uncharacterized protein n=1 Tax=Streptomyces nigrescens TaxID=1920 RepID=A0ABM7ZWC3_STRNI|nr:hypothetical protein HEK616_41460 [Streptomyces nigrescens]